MLKRRTSATLLALALAASIGACGDGPKALQPPVHGSTPAPGDTRLYYKVRFKMQARGAETFSVDRETVLDVHEISGGRNPVAIWFLTVSTGTKLELDDGRLLTFSADLAPGTYKGPGRYTIDGSTQGKVLGVESNIGSASYVALSDLTKRPPGYARYEVLVKPCTLVFEEDARSGRVDCPALGNSITEGEVLNVTWSWERL